MPSNSSEAKTYIVWKGRNPGIYHTWAECEREVKGVSAIYKSFKGITREEAERLFAAGPYSDEAGYGKRRTSSECPGKSPNREQIEIPKGAWAVDAATSHNPGPMEYRGVDIDSGKVIFASKVYPVGTNNIGEFLAIVHAFALMLKTGERHIVYSDSRNAQSWVRQKACKTKLPRTPETEELYQVIDRALTFLRTHDLTGFDLRKWPTRHLGEIPADYGRK